MMRTVHRRIFLLVFVILCSIIHVQGQEEDLPYPKKLTVKLGMGPTYLAVDYGYHLQNQFELELGKHFTLSAAYGTAQAYEGLDDVQRWYFPPGIDIREDDHFRHQTLLFANMGLQIVPLNLKHHRLFVSLGPSFNHHNFSKVEILPHRDSVAFVLTNSKTTNFSYNVCAGYDLIMGDHIVLGLSFYYVRFTEDMYSVLFHGGYRF